MQRAPRVLIVEDEAPIRDGLVDLFSGQGFTVESVADGREGLARLTCNQYDLVLLDIMLPGLDGLSVLRRFRARGDLSPVLMLTAKGAESDIVAGIEAGADDYVTKPFGIRELLARARGLLRRQRAHAQQRQQAGAHRTTRFVIGGDASQVTLDADRLHIEWPAGRVTLTPREGAILTYLIGHHHRPVSRGELLTDVWGYRDGSIRTRTVDMHMAQLRGKLKAVPGGPKWIATVRGRGYRFDAKAEPEANAGVYR